MSEYFSISRGTVVSANDGPKMQELTIRDWYGDKKTGVEHWQPAGFVSVPLPPKDGKEAEVLIAHLGGSADHPVVIGTADRRSRPTGAKPGDMIFYDPRDNQRRISFDEDGTLNIAMPSDGKMKMAIGGVSMTLSKDGVDFAGGYIKHNGKRIDAQHKHEQVQPGAGVSGIPIALVAGLVGADLVVRLIGLIAGYLA